MPGDDSPYIPTLLDPPTGSGGGSSPVMPGVIPQPPPGMDRRFTEPHGAGPGWGPHPYGRPSPYWTGQQHGFPGPSPAVREQQLWGHGSPYAASPYPTRDQQPRRLTPYQGPVPMPPRTGPGGHYGRSPAYPQGGMLPSEGWQYGGAEWGHDQYHQQSYGGSPYHGPHGHFPERGGPGPPYGDFGDPMPPPPPMRAESEIIVANPWWAGKGYGPVLDPLQVTVTRTRLRVNPLLDHTKDGIPVLRWNMLFPAHYTQHSEERSNISWRKGRSEPATFPRVTSIRIISPIIPWILTIHARDGAVGITCGDVIDQLGHAFYTHLSRSEVDALPAPTKQRLEVQWRVHRQVGPTVPGSLAPQGIARLDWLTERTCAWDGLSVDDAYTIARLGEGKGKRFGGPPSCVFVLHGGPAFDPYKHAHQSAAPRRSPRIETQTTSDDTVTEFERLRIEEEEEVREQREHHRRERRRADRSTSHGGGRVGFQEHAVVIPPSREDNHAADEADAARPEGAPPLIRRRTTGPRATTA